MKVVINACYGGFGLSDEAHKALGHTRETGTQGGSGYWVPHATEMCRHNEALVKVVERLGEAAGDSFSRPCVVEIPDGITYEIVEYDGLEHIAESHRTWS